MIFFDADIIGPWVSERIGRRRYIPGTASAIGRIKDGKIVAGVLYEDFNKVNISCHIAGEGPGWMSRRFLSIIFDYPFNQLKVNRITGYVASSNAAAINLDEKLGFKREAILHGADPDGDLIIYVMRREDCRWLKDLPYERVFESGHTRPTDTSISV